MAKKLFATELLNLFVIVYLTNKGICWLFYEVNFLSKNWIFDTYEILYLILSLSICHGGDKFLRSCDRHSAGTVTLLACERQSAGTETLWACDRHNARTVACELVTVTVPEPGPCEFVTVTVPKPWPGELVTVTAPEPWLGLSKMLPNNNKL